MLCECCLSFGPLPSSELKTRHIFTVRRPWVIKPTPLLTGPLEVALLGTTIQSVLHILTLASAQCFFSQGSWFSPSYWSCDTRYYALLNASPKAGGSDDTEYRCRGETMFLGCLDQDLGLPVWWLYIKSYYGLLGVTQRSINGSRRLTPGKSHISNHF